jgi:histidinol-phosphate phosphatase family protein
MDRAIFFDRDGTLNDDVGYLKHPSELILYPETLPALKRLQPHFRFFIVTNQPCIAEGIATAGEVDSVNAGLLDILARGGIRVEKVYVCPHTRAQGCECVKPNPHFLHKAAAEFGIDLARSFVIGDHPHDVELARAAGATGVYVLTGHGEKHRAKVKPDITITRHIGEAADHVLTLIG